MYDDGRFFTMTGERMGGTPESVRERAAALQDIHQAYVATSDSEPADEPEAYVVKSRQLTFEPALSNEQVIEKARSASNGEKFAALWDGQTSGYDSHSEADMALCCLLAFWTDGDPSRVDELFRQSGLLRPKWDEVHYADGATYGERTIERACSRVTDYYSQTESK
jgi:primase-polymerase (primpol)-like protein